MRGLMIAACAAMLFLAGCGGSSTPTPTLPPATPIPTPTPAPLDLHGSDLLQTRSSGILCDQGNGAQINCSHTDAGVHIAIDSNASNFARWALKLGPTQPLTGNETLVVRARSDGGVNPNLYLVEADGDRLPISLTKFGLNEALHDVIIPLREIADDSGNRPDFQNIAEIQVVFEWADMRGALDLAALHFEPVWEESVELAPASVELASKLTLPPGFVARPFLDNVRAMTEIVFATNGDMFVSQQDGRIWRYLDTDGDGMYDRRQLYDHGYTEIVGILYDPADNAVWLGGRGQLFYTLDSNGDGAADIRELRIDGMPWGRHQNNGLVWNPDPDPFTGEPGGTFLYFGLGSTGDMETGSPINATVLRFPRTGQSKEDVEVVSSGNRNAYNVIWAQVPVNPQEPEGATAWQLFASENGPDFNDAPDEVNHIRWGHNYGFPDQFGRVQAPATEGNPFSSPIYPVSPHASADGLAYITNPAWPAEYRTLYVALFGEVFSPDRVGHTVERIALEETGAPDDKTYRGTPSDFITGLDRPLPLAVAPDGNMLVGDYATGVIYHVSYGAEAPAANTGG